MIKKYPGLVQIVRKGWLEAKIEKIMKTEATVKQFKDFLKLIGIELIKQEKHKMLMLKNNLYEKVRYYLNKRASTAQTGTRNTRQIYYNNNEIQLNTEGDLESKIHEFFQIYRQKKPETPDMRFVKTMVVSNQKSKSKNQNMSKNKHFKRSCKKDNFWDYEIDKLVELFEGKSKNSAFKYCSPRENILDVNQVYSHRSANSCESNDFNSSQKSDCGK